MNGSRNGLAAQRLRVRQFHGFAAWLQLVSAYNFVESRISATLREDDLTLAQFALFGLCKKSTGGPSVGDQGQPWLVSSTGLAPADSWNGVAPRRTDA